MKKYYYDLHIHSCLSPCGDDESTPDSIAGMGEINSLDIMAITDHNTCKNCPAFFEAALNHGLLPVAGMELTTSEEIHVVCLFSDLESAMEFDGEVQKRRILIPNRVDIFGNQLVCDSEDNIISKEEYLLSNATTLSLDELPDLISRYNGICYPAHIDRGSNSVTSVLGVFPQHLNFTCAEVHDKLKLEEFASFSQLPKEKLISSSDAHYLWDINERTNYLLLPEITDRLKAGKYIIDFLRGQS